MSLMSLFSELKVDRPRRSDFRSERAVTALGKVNLDPYVSEYCRYLRRSGGSIVCTYNVQCFNPKNG